MELSDLYYRLLLNLILEEYQEEFSNARAGHCMKITGLGTRELMPLCAKIRALHPVLSTFILSDDQKGGEYISANKLIEYRNDDTISLLVLIPSSTRTSTEDSYGDATFKNLPVQHLDDKLFSILLGEVPDAVKPVINEILEYLKIQGIRKDQCIQYLLYVRLSAWSDIAVGNGLAFLSLLPDDIITGEINRVRQRLSFNLKCINTLGDFSLPVPDRIQSLPIEQNSLQKEITLFFKAENHLKSKAEIAQSILKSHPHLNFSKWPIPDFKIARNLHVFVDRISSKDLKITETGLTLTVPQDKSSKLKIRVSTKPAPKDFNELKNFRIQLMAIDGWYPVSDIKKLKVTENTKEYRETTIEFSAAMFEEGSYFLRVWAEDENGSVLNLEDEFVPTEWEDFWKTEKQKNPELTRNQFKEQNRVKCTNDSDDFYLNFGTEEEGGETVFTRKDKLDNVLQAYYRYRIEQLRMNNEESVPVPVEDSGIWLKGGHSGLVSTYHIKYSVNHNYQINLSNKLHKLQSCFIKNAGQLGSIVAGVSSNPTENNFTTLHFNAFCATEKVPESILLLRKELFEAIAKSAPDSTGVFETFDLFNHIDLTRKYIVEYQEFTKSVRKEIETGSADSQNCFQLLVELQNLDMVTIKTEMPDGQIICLKLISPLHPLRLGWSVNLFDLFSSWEEETRIFPHYKSVWYKNLENLFLGDLIPDIAMPVLAENLVSEYFQYIGELSFGWGIYSKPVQKGNDAFSSIARQLKIYLSGLLNIAKEYRIDTDISKLLVGRHLQNYLVQHPYAEKLVINLFNAGDASVFANAMVELEKLPEFRSLKYEVRLFAEDKIIIPGEAFRDLLNPESNISEDAEAFSQASVNRLFPKLRFSINSVEEFINNPADFIANISFLVSPFPVKTALTRPDDCKQSFYFNGLICKQVVSVTQKPDAIIWNKYFSENPVSSAVNDFCNIGVSLFSDMQSFIAHSLSSDREQSVPSTRLELNESDKVLLSLIHDASDWVITFDKNMGPEVYDLPGREGEIPFLLDYVPGDDISGISSFLTTRPTSEIVGLLGPHFAEYGIDLRNEHEKLKLMLEDIRSISSSLILQFNSTSNRAFEVLGAAFTKRVLEKKRILENAFLIPVDLHKELFEKLPGEDRERADALLVKMNPENHEISIMVIEIKCRTSLPDAERTDLVAKMQSQISNTIEALRFHFDKGYTIASDRFDRELKTLQFKSLLEFYLNRSARYNHLSPEVRDDYMKLIDNLNYGYSLSFKRLGIIYDFSAAHRHKKESFGDDTTFFTFGRNMIGEILDPDSDLNTRRLENIIDDEKILEYFGMPISNLTSISPVVSTSAPSPKAQPEIPETTSAAPVNYVPEPSNEVPGLQETSQPDTLPTAEEPTQVMIGIESGTMDTPRFDILIGKSSSSPQYGVLGKIQMNNKSVALDLSETHTISLFGVQGGGKSYSIGTIAEMVLRQISNINQLPAPLAGVIFHFSESMDYEPEFTSMVYPNDKEDELRKLREEYHAEPNSLSDVILLTPGAKVNERKQKYPSIEVHPISFNSNELNVQDWMFLLGAIGNDSTYIRQLKATMRSIRDNISLQALRSSVVASTLLTTTQKSLAEQRLLFAQEYINDQSQIRNLLRPGRLIIVDLRDPFIEKDEALGLFVVMLNIFSGIRTYADKAFNKFIVFDEAHKYMDNQDLTGSIVTAIREMRHKGVSIMIASQDPMSLPNEIIELSSIVLLHKFNSPLWIKHIQKSITQFAPLTPSDMSALIPGEGYLWASKSTDKSLMQRPIKISTRPRVTKHGGETQTAI